MNTGILIGFAGAKGSGKDTAASELINEYGFKHWAFAGPLKEACGAMFHLSQEQLHGHLKETPDPRWFGCTPRKIFQYVGTELFRDQLDQIMPGLGNDVHIHSFKIWYQEHKNENIVVTDVRFPNEVEAIHNLGGKVIRINRQTTGTEDGHASEQSFLLKVDYDVSNNGSIEELHNGVLRALNQIYV